MNQTFTDYTECSSILGHNAVTVSKEGVCDRAQRMNQYRVLLIEDHAEFRNMLRSLLEPEFSVVAELADGEQAIEAVRSFDPDIVLLDITLPGKNGLDVIRDLLGSFPALRVIFLTTHSDRVYIDEAFRRGALGFVSKGSASSSLLAELRRTLAS